MNPITAWRTTHNLSVNDLADLARTTNTAIRRTESGCYTLVPPRIVSALLTRPTVIGEVALTHGDEIQTAYEDFQKVTRRLTYLEGSLSLDLPPLSLQAVGAVSDVTPNVVPSPLMAWRLLSGVSSQLELCKLLCLHPYVVEKTENGIQRTLPKQLVAALEQAGWDDSFITELAERQFKYASK